MATCSFLYVVKLKSTDLAGRTLQFPKCTWLPLMQAPSPDHLGERTHGSQEGSRCDWADSKHVVHG